MKILLAFALALFALAPTTVAQTVNGDMNAAFATGKWKESNEGVVLNCVRVTTQKEVIRGNSEGVCFLTEAQAMAKDSVVMSSNLFSVTSWDVHNLSATTDDFYTDKNGDQTSKSAPGAIKFVFRLVLNLDAHQMTKFVEASTGKTGGYHLVSN